MDELQSDATKLRDLSRLKATPDRIAQVQSALSSKWEGTQSIAIEVMARWGGKEAKEAIRKFLLDAFSRDHGWSIRGVAVRALAKMAGPEDVGWVLDLYFLRPTALDKHELLPLVLGLPADVAKPRLIRELSSHDPLNRHAAVKAIGNMPYQDRGEILRPLHGDPDKAVRESAKVLTGGEILSRRPAP